MWGKAWYILYNLSSLNVCTLAASRRTRQAELLVTGGLLLASCVVFPVMHILQINASFKSLKKRMFFDFKNLLYFSLNTVKIMSLLSCFTFLQGTIVHIFRTMLPLSLSGLIFSSVPCRFPTTDKFSRFLHLALNQASEKPFMTSAGLKNQCFCHVQVSSESFTAAKIQGLTSRHLLRGLRCKSLQQCADQECGLVPKSQPTHWRQPLLPVDVTNRLIK